ncbi:MAG TPA: cupin domain-containing protein [Terriglobales bacterium]|nr:cupin domain-containing protein [Terriglobales bacterium]
MIDKSTAQHYVWGGGCDGWRLVQTPTLSVIEERMPPGTEEVRHYHRESNQFFYVLKGILSVEVEGREFELTVGQGVQIPPKTPHQLWNRHSVDAEFLVISNPPSHGDRITAEVSE